MGSGIEVFYVVCAASGFLFTLFAALSGHHGRAGGHHGHFGHGAHHGHFSGRLGRAGHHGGGSGARASHGGQGARGAQGAHSAHGAHGAQAAQGAHGSGQQGQAQIEQGPQQGMGGEAVPFISPLTIAMFVGSFGFLGIILRSGMALSPEASMMLATPSALLVTVMLFWVFVKVFVASESTSLTRIEECIGAEAEVVAKIEAGRIGSIAYVDKGARITLPARSDGDAAFNRGDRVYISRFEGNTAFVQAGRSNLWDA